jgi:O-acetyl-ADP-ribose deacetylase
MSDYKGCRYCLHYRVDGTCPAFEPRKIPLSIVSGQIKHLYPMPEQRNDIVYEPSEESISYKVADFFETNRQMREKIGIILGDITNQKVDAIVNSANESLMAGGGVSGAIHHAAGLGLEEECLNLNGCEEGQAKITKGYNLQSPWVIHTVGPVWEGGKYDEDLTLAQCYRSCFELAELYHLKTIAFPAISSGVYGFPIENASRIAMGEARLFLEKKIETFEKIMFVCQDEQTYNCYINVWTKFFPLEEEYS